MTTSDDFAKITNILKDLPKMLTFLKQNYNFAKMEYPG